MKNYKTKLIFMFLLLESGEEYVQNNEIIKMLYIK